MVNGGSSFIENGGNPYLANFSSKHSDTGWLVLTGATHHICYDLNWFISYTKIEPISVNLHNGSNIEAHCRTQVKLFDVLNIYNVLYLL